MMFPVTDDLSDWFASLVVDFPDADIPRLEDPENWKEAGEDLVQEEPFVENGAPDTVGFDSAKDWAQAVFYTMANY